MDATDLYADFDQDASTMLDEVLSQLEYHREQMRYYRRLKAKLEDAIPKYPDEEMVDIARAAWTQR
jgi:hypothetical protein